MKTLHWGDLDPATGEPYRYDDPNVRWGFVLEAGDEGFTPPAAPISPQTTTKPKAKPMKHQDYYPVRQADQAVWLENFANKLPGYATALGLTNAERDAAVADALWLDYILTTWLPALRAFTQACTAANTQAQKGTGGLLALPVFAPAAPAAGVVPRLEGSLTRIFELVVKLKVNTACTPAMCEDMRIVGATETPPDFTTFRPELALRVLAAGVFIAWTWLGKGKWLDSLEIQVDRGTGWQILTFDTTPDYTDTHPFPATLTQWKYRAIWRVDDGSVGLWSEVLTVAVGG